MPNIFLASDHHLHHANILTFLKPNGENLRAFPCIEDHDEHIIKCHNETVRPKDKIYFLGDVCFSHKHLHLLGRMNGEKVLIKGNHDKLKLSQYAPYFKDVRGSHQLDKLVLTHIPIHPYSLDRWLGNVHGHLHHNRVPSPHFGDEWPDPRYINVCVECINYTPISLEEVKSQLKSLT